MRSPTRRRRLIGALAALLAVGASPLVLDTPASAAGPVTLTMTPGEGELHIRDSATPAELGSPTTITGEQAADGSLSNLAISTPMIPVVQHITSPLEADVFIDITLSMRQPGSGGVDQDGNVFVSAPVTVDLHVEVGNPALVTADCTSPVDLELTSTAPYDPAVGEVTLSAPDFTIPTFQTSATCSSLVAGPINAQLAGSGHSLTVPVTGDLALGEAPKAATTTTVTASPSPVNVGQPVALTATVTSSDPAATEPPTGSVEFRDGSTLLGAASVDENGTATLNVSTLPVGTRTITANYLGDFNFSASSGTVSVKVTTNPWMTVEIPNAVTIGAPPVPFDIVVTNSNLGAPTANLRVDGYASAFTRLFLEVQGDDGVWTHVPAGQLVATAAPFGDAAGFTLAPGQTKVIKARVSGIDSPANAILYLRLVTFDPATPTTLTQLQLISGPIGVGVGERMPSMVKGGLGATPAVTPVVIQRGTLEAVRMTPSAADGTFVPVTNPMFQFEIDGRPVAVRGADKPIGSETTDPVVISPNMLVNLPDLAPGPHVLTARFLGSQSLLPTNQDFPFTVVARSGALYDCTITGGAANTAQWHGRARVVALGTLPTEVVAGRPVPVANPAVSLEFERASTAVTKWNVVTNGVTTALPNSAVLKMKDVTFNLGDAGTGTATSVTRANGTLLSDPADPNPTQQVTFGGETMTVDVDAAAGSVLPVQLAAIDFNVNPSNTGTCVPVDAPISLGSVTVVGTTLTVDAPNPTRVGDEVTLTASVLPANAAG